MSDLVERLTKGKHPIAAGQYRDVVDLQQSIERDFVLIKFTETLGGTELGFKLNKSLTDLENADFEAASGTAHLVGELSLDDKQVRFIADIDLSTLKGEGYLELLTTQEADAPAVGDKTSSGETIH